MEPERPEPLESPPWTAWHPMLVALLSRFLPRGYKLLPEYLLSRLSQRADILVVRLEEEPGPVEKIHSILDYLAAHTLIEYKGPTDDLAGEDLLALLGYGYQYLRIAKVKDPKEACLMVIADRITPSFLAQTRLSEVPFSEIERGIWRGQFGGFLVHGVETGKAAERGPSEHLLYTFSRFFLEHPEGVRPLDPEEMEVYLWLYQQVEQFKRARGAMAVKDIEALEKSFAQVMESLGDKISIEARLRGLSPEDVLARFAPAQRLQGLAPEQRLQGLAPAQRLQGLTPEQLEELKRLLH